ILDPVPGLLLGVAFAIGVVLDLAVLVVGELLEVVVGFWLLLLVVVLLVGLRARHGLEVVVVEVLVLVGLVLVLVLVGLVVALVLVLVGLVVGVSVLGGDLGRSRPRRSAVPAVARVEVVVGPEDVS